MPKTQLKNYVVPNTPTGSTWDLHLEVRDHGLSLPAPLNPAEPLLWNQVGEQPKYLTRCWQTTSHTQSVELCFDSIMLSSSGIFM